MNIRQLARGNRGLLVFVALVLVIHVRIYQAYPYRPIGPDSGWERFWDQGQYVKSTRALARGDLAPDQHWYPIGYSALGAPFVGVLPNDPFLVVNGGCLALFAVAFVRYFRPLIGLIPSALAFFGSLAVPTASAVSPIAPAFPLWVQFVIPWNTIPIAATYMWLLSLLRDRNARTLGVDAAIGGLAAATAVIRPTDALPLLPLGVLYGVQSFGSDQPLRRLAAATAAAAAVLVPVLAVTLRIHGGFSTPYAAEASAIGMTLSDLHERAAATLLGAAATFGEVGTAVFELQPWHYAGFPLACVWAFREPRMGLAPVATALASLLLYLSFNDFWPFNVMRFSLIHYIVWLLPVMSAAGIAGAVILVRRRAWIATLAVAAAVVALVCFRVEPRRLVPQQVQIRHADGVTTYTLTFPTARELDAIDLAGATAQN
jgi:hypothetical protein